MTLDLARSNPNGKVLIWVKHGRKNQKFKILEKDGKFVIWSLLGSAIHIPNNSAENGEHLLGTK